MLVDESILLDLQRGAADKTTTISTNDRSRFSGEAQDPAPAPTQEASILEARSVPKHDTENSTIEVFVSKLKQIQGGLRGDDTRLGRSDPASPGNVGSGTGSLRAYEYFTLNTDEPRGYLAAYSSWRAMS